MRLEVGSIFRVDGEIYEFSGVFAAENSPGETKIVGLANPDAPMTHGQVYKVFDQKRLEDDGEFVYAFTEELPYSYFVKERETWRKMFDPEIAVPRPPVELMDTLKRMRKMGWDSFEPHYLPPAVFNQEGITLDSKSYNYPDSWEKPEEHSLFWLDGQENPELMVLPRMWILADTVKPPGSESDVYDNDHLGELIANLRMGNSSRNFFQREPIRRSLNPLVANKLGVEPKQVRMMRFIEFNVLGNMFYPGWGEFETIQHFFDTVKRYNAGEFYLSGGYKSINDGSSGLTSAHVESGRPSGGFRHVVVFPNTEGGEFK